MLQDERQAFKYEELNGTVREMAKDDIKEHNA